MKTPETPPPEGGLPKEDTPHEKAKKHSRNWGRIGAIASIVGTAAGILALYPIAFKESNHSQSEQHIFDGPIARIATQERGWDKRGFDPKDMDSGVNEIIYRFAGHFLDPINGDRNPNNAICTIKLRANPSNNPPYHGDSGFVYIQPGGPKQSQGTILYNPTLAAVYQTWYDHDFVPPECWPGNFKFPHEFPEYQ
jgi:hypothetical protein